MAIEVKDPIYELGEKATYVTVNGVKYAVVRERLVRPDRVRERPCAVWQIAVGSAGGRNQGQWKILRRENCQARPQPGPSGLSRSGAQGDLLPCRSGDIHGRLQEEAAP
ncbi:hypothetical protein AWB69_09043 [Caballeronia udeis]|uniref:Uncharacterized protein n=1 Tax=Caballeronia udeis TaxID=1232866 RepID=A0A158JXS8_9BURK|nr:hypothetical protein AWB69_09043 [Caballeronia udeis]